MKIRCLIVDDEPLARSIIAQYASKLPYLAIVGNCEDAVEASEFLRHTDIDLVFLDINMPGIDGMTFAKTLDNSTQVIFTTAYPEYAVEGFNINAVDYLLKPIRFERFQQAVNKAREKLGGSPDDSDFIMVKVDRLQHKVHLRDIYYIEGYGDFVKIHLTDSVLVGSGSLKFWAEKLAGETFLRIHKSFIINLHIIQSLESDKLITPVGHVPIGNKYKKILNEALGN